MFTRKRQIDGKKLHLVNEFLENLIGETKENCRELAEKKDFIFLDGWDNKLGFIKESLNEYLILSLHFEDNKCDFYQVIVKKMDR